MSWIKANDKEFKTFVENRLREIRNNTDVENWSYCPTEFNPADLMTRVGITKNFIENKLWWEGPEFLKLNKEQMFQFSIPESNFDTEVRKASSTCLSLNAEKVTCNMNNVIDFNRYSNYDKVLNPLIANPTKWPDTLKKFVGKLATNCLSVFDHFVKLVLKV